MGGTLPIFPPNMPFNSKFNHYYTRNSVCLPLFDRFLRRTLVVALLVLSDYTASHVELAQTYCENAN